jgi:hypothetical protein
MNSTSSTSSSEQTVRMVCSQKVSIASVNTARRYLVQNQMRVQQRHAVPGAAIGLGCQYSPLRL